MPWRYIGRPLSVRFPSANTPTEVRHLLAEVPDGFLVLNADAAITRAPGQDFTKELAYLQASRANATAVLAFGVFREAAIDVNP